MTKSEIPKAIFKNPIHDKVHWIITKHLKDHIWHGFCCATCCELIYELDEYYTFEKNKVECIWYNKGLEAGTNIEKRKKDNKE